MMIPKVSLDDKFTQAQGRVFITGVQTLLRVMMDQSRRDEAAGVNTAGFISGYRGSPLGGLDQQARRAAAVLQDRRVLFKEAINEDLGATAVWGTQQVNLNPGALYDGVFGMWYGKAPGVDRTGDAFRHANFAGTWPKGGVLAVAGDDHACKSSTLPSQSEFAFQDLEMPVLAPADVQEVLDYGLLGIALSRFSGLWTGLIALADTMDSGSTIEVGPHRGAFVLPEGFSVPTGGLGIRLKDQPLDKERRLRLHKVPAALAFARANALDRVMLTSHRPRLGIVAHGQAWADVAEALRAIGLSFGEAADLGVSLYKVGMPWPLEPVGLRAFASGLETLLVVEHKRPLLETQIRSALYDLPAHAQPKVIGKIDETGQPLLSSLAALSVAEVALAIADRLPPGPHMERVHAYLNRVSASGMAAVTLGADQARKPYFCSGCPHNSSTRLPEGSRALAGIGCHYMASFSDPRTDLTSHMGGEGLTWAGTAPFTREGHVFVNLGDGTYNHSGSLAIRGAVAMGANITYKLLFNDAVAMTGGQQAESGFTVPQITRQLTAEGVARIVIVADDPDRYADVRDLADGVEVRPRDALMNVQETLRATKGVTVLIYDQVCATERRRRRKRGLTPESPRRAFINPLVCEGCGDCSAASHCVSLEPLETEFGRKRRIDTSTCNQDFSCLEGLCPSFVTLEGARATAKAGMSAAKLTPPVAPVIAPPATVYNLVFTGVGGTGVTTVASILAMAAHLDGLTASVVDMTGLAQKNGSVFSHLRIGPAGADCLGGRTPAASADAVIACDLMVAAGPDALALYAKSRTVACGNGDVAPTADFVTDRDARFEADPMARRLAAACRAYDGCRASALAESYFGDTVFSNMIMLGFAWQKGLVPVTREAILDAIALNGAAVEQNHQAFDLGRVAAADPTFRPAADAAESPETQPLDRLIANRTAELTAYQDAAYAARYAERVARLRAAELAAGGDELAVTRAAAVQLHRLMAIKDEYEVARLYTDGRFARELAADWTGGRLKVWLAPPLLSRPGRDGRPRKIAFGGWVIRWLFPLLARMKGVRGSALDLFGATQERRRERRLLADYESWLDRIAAELDSSRLVAAERIARAPADVRGFGAVRAAAEADLRRRESALWAAWSGSPSRGRALPLPKLAATH